MACNTNKQNYEAMDQPNKKNIVQFEQIYIKIINLISLIPIEVPCFLYSV